MTKITAHEQGSSVILHYQQDIEPHLKAAKAARRNDAEYRTDFGKRAELRHTMHIPMNVWLQVCAKLQIPFGEALAPEHKGRIMGELKGADYRDLRVVNDKHI